MKQLRIYVDASAIGGCEDAEFARDSLTLWQMFVRGDYFLILSEHTLREIAQAPEAVRKRLSEIPDANRIVIADSDEVDDLANAYLKHRAVSASSRADALHVAMATVSGADVLVSWNFKHLVNLGRIRRFNAVNLEKGYAQIEIRSPKEVLTDEKGI